MESRQEAKLNLDEFLRIVDVASAMRQEQEKVEGQLDIDQAKLALAEKLRKTAEVTGEQLTELQIQAAVDNYFKGLYSFQAPERDFGVRLAETYADRAGLTRKFVIPPVAVAAIAGALFMVGKAGYSMHLRSAERTVEGAVESAWQERKKLSAEISEISSSPFAAQLPETEKDKIKAAATASENRLRDMMPFFDRYCSGGTSQDDVTAENYPNARRELVPVEKSMEEVRGNMKNGRQIIQTQEGLVLTRRSLDSLVGEIRGSKPLAAFSQRAEALYLAGISEIERRNIEEAKKKAGELAEVKGDIAKFATLVPQIETLYGGIKTLSKEPEALQRGEELYRGARQTADSADVAGLAKSVSQLQGLAATLEQEYTVRIVNRPGVKSGIDRYFTDNSGKRASGWYLIVEAVDSKQQVLPVEVRNEENGQVERVQMWGERVPEQVYDKVKADKMDNGLIENDTVGKKRKGYLKEEMTMPGVTKQGEITRW